MMKQRIVLFTSFVMLTLMTNTTATAHFGMLIPSDTMVMQQDQRQIHLTLSFSHPMEMVGMDLAKPKVFKVVANEKHKDLSQQLVPIQVLGHAGWKAEYAVKRPGVYTFYMEPHPYWEPAEAVRVSEEEVVGEPPAKPAQPSTERQKPAVTKKTPPAIPKTDRPVPRRAEPKPAVRKPPVVVRPAQPTTTTTVATSARAIMSHPPDPDDSRGAGGGVVGDMDEHGRPRAATAGSR